MAAIAKKKKKIDVGDEVDVRLGATIWHVRIVEDRGPIGLEGRKMLRVQILDGLDGSPQLIEVPLDFVLQR